MLRLPLNCTGSKLSQISWDASKIRGVNIIEGHGSLTTGPLIGRSSFILAPVWLHESFWSPRRGVGFLCTFVIARANTGTLEGGWQGLWSLPFLQQLIFVLDQNWISSYRGSVSKYCSSILSNLICGSPGGTVRHQPPSKTCPVRIEAYGNKTIWFTGIATPPYPKVRKKLTETLFCSFNWCNCTHKKGLPT